MIIDIQDIRKAKNTLEKLAKIGNGKFADAIPELIRIENGFKLLQKQWNDVYGENVANEGEKQLDLAERFIDDNHLSGQYKRWKDEHQ